MNNDRSRVPLSHLLILCPFHQCRELWSFPPYVELAFQIIQKQFCLALPPLWRHRKTPVRPSQCSAVSITLVRSRSSFYLIPQWIDWIMLVRVKSSPMSVSTNVPYLWCLRWLVVAGHPQRDTPTPSNHPSSLGRVVEFFLPLKLLQCSKRRRPDQSRRTKPKIKTSMMMLARISGKVEW